MPTPSPPPAKVEIESKPGISETRRQMIEDEGFEEYGDLTIKTPMPIDEEAEWRA